MLFRSKEHEIDILIWNYHDDDLAVPAASINLEVDGFPAAATRGVLEHFRVDSQHSNSFAAWKEMGSPESLSAEQVEQLQGKGQLQLLESPREIMIEHGLLQLRFGLPRQGLSLVRFTW